MASKTLQLKNQNHKTLKTLLKPSSNFTLSHLYSSSASSSSDNNNNNNGDNSPKKPTDFSSYFSDVKSRLKNTDQQHYQRQKPFKISESEEIRRNLSEFRRRSNFSAGDLYKKSNPNANPNPNPNPNTLLKGNTYDGIRESLRQLRGSQIQKGKEVNNPLSLNQYKATFKPSSQTPMAGGGGGKVYGGSLDSLPIVAFGKELRDKEKKRGEMGKDGGVRDDRESTRFTRFYTYDELGKRLKDLRPEGVEKANGDGAEGNWFSLAELNERLVKLREIEENLSQKNGFGILKRSALEVKQQKEEQEQKKAAQRLFILGGLHSIKDSTPKEHLIEKYFHPDNMSSEEKLKLKLKEVRDGFKMHESDCGSARVQIAQLTTEISHLSSVLHKKDKHSRRGLLAKVQQRKKLLKYLRKTDWDSYCFVLSKLSLRDNPDYKN